MIGRISAKLRGAGMRWQEWQVRRAIEARWAEQPATIPVPLGAAPVIVSLTSYPPRFATLALTLKSLLTQSLRPEAVILWIGEKDMAALPADVRALAEHGLTIRACEDLRSFTKFIHALREFPRHRIAICDDDTWYRPHWLADLAVDLPAGQIACHRIHRVRLDASGAILPYNQWEQESSATDASPLNFPTGVGGVMLRSDMLDARIVDAATARALCPSADDVWLYWMGLLASSLFVRVGNQDPLISWRASQHVALWRTNNVESTANDEQIARMTETFGPLYREGAATARPRIEAAG
jgi:hypothetical protein